MDWKRIAAACCAGARSWCTAPVYFGRSLASVPPGALVLFAYRPDRLHCGLAGIVAFKRPAAPPPPLDLAPLTEALETVAAGLPAEVDPPPADLSATGLGGEAAVARLLAAARQLKKSEAFYALFTTGAPHTRLVSLSRRLDRLASDADRVMESLSGRLDPVSVNVLTSRIDRLKDAAWCLSEEVLANIERVRRLMSQPDLSPDPAALQVYQHLNTTLCSLDRLEVRGRDSAGISLLFTLESDAYETLLETLAHIGLAEAFAQRQSDPTLRNRGISVHPATGDAGRTAIGLTYKVAAEIGSLGDNIIHLRWQIHTDAILHAIVNTPGLEVTISAHTRWASVGAITEANCHPVDNGLADRPAGPEGIIHACLNGDIDNYRLLRQAYETRHGRIPADITSDTKIIPLQISHYLAEGFDLPEAFRRAVNDFEGSHAIAMHSDLAPGRLFLAQRGSGQAIFVGLADELYMSTSEVYGFVEATDRYLKLDGEKVHHGPEGPSRGQIVVLDARGGGGLAGLRALAYDGTPLALTEEDVKQTDITTRDVDRQGYAHYFLKEITEAPQSVARTLHNRWKCPAGQNDRYQVTLDAATFPPAVSEALAGDRIRRIYFVGQGTAGVAAQACANILAHYLADPHLPVGAMKASELSGFHLDAEGGKDAMADALVVAISQSGTTTDTNRAVDMARTQGAMTLAIVNRRDSDLTFKVDGVVYTSSGRDIEMSVASTKAFYAQIVAGALLALHIAVVRGRRSAPFVTHEIRNLLDLPRAMRSVLDGQDRIERSARRLAATKTYWAAVGSGPNKASADEIRIKLSELCYKTISSDYVEDKKHIDLSSEPLILVCAAGTRGPVMGDIVKDTAIFNAHKATPVVICDEGEHRFAPYAADVFHVPAVAEHLAPIVNTLAGHLWGYYAALTINDGSRVLFQFREETRQSIEAYTAQGMDVYEIILEKAFREKAAEFYRAFRTRRHTPSLPLSISLASDLALLLKYLAGRLPMTDFEIDFGVKGTARNMLDTLFARLGEAINLMARPVDAIKHQAKTVTVGTSRIREKTEGLLFEALAAHDLNVSRLTNRNILVLRHLQQVVASIEGAILYRVRHLNLLGEPTDATTIAVERKSGVLKPIPSRVETDPRLQGTKRIIVQEGNVYIGKGRKDGRSILVIPVLGASPETPNTIEHLLLLNIAFRQETALADRIKALGGKFERIQSLVQENSVVWKDGYLDRVPVDELFGRSAEKIAEVLVQKVG